MTPEELQELRDWAARKMGWTESYPFGKEWMGPDLDSIYGMDKDQWLPDRPESGQIWMVVEKMRDLKYDFDLTNCYDPLGYKARFWLWKPKLKVFGRFDPNPCLAILKAAMATED